MPKQLNPDGEMTFNRERLQRLFEAYERAREEGEDEFIFGGHQFVTKYAKYLFHEIGQNCPPR